MELSEKELIMFRLLGVKKITIKQGYFGFTTNIEFFEKGMLSKEALVKTINKGIKKENKRGEKER